MQYFGASQFSLRKFIAFAAAALALSLLPIRPVNAVPADSKGEIFRFPKQVDDFQRQSRSNSVLNGIFARADYVKKMGENEVSVTIDIIHLLEMSPVEHFAIRKANLVNEYPNLVLKKQGEYKMKNLPPRSGHFGRFESSDGNNSEAIGVWTFDLGAWDIYINARYPKGKKAIAEDDIKRLLTAIDWELLKNTRPQDTIE